MQKITIVIFLAILLVGSLSLWAQNSSEVYQKTEEETVNPATIGSWISEKTLNVQIDLIKKLESATDANFIYRKATFGQSIEKIMLSEEASDDAIYYGRNSMSMAGLNMTGLAYLLHIRDDMNFAILMYLFDFNHKGLSQVVTGLMGPPMTTEEAASYISFVENLYENEYGLPTRRYTTKEHGILGLEWQSDRKDFMIFIPNKPIIASNCSMNIQIYVVSSAQGSLKYPAAAVKLLDEGIKKGCTS